MSWLTIKKGRTTPEGWNGFKPRLLHVGFKANVFFPNECNSHHGRHRLWGTKFLGGDSMAIDWTPCLEPSKIALHLNVVSCGMDYSYTLVSVATQRPCVVQVVLQEHKRILVSVDSFDGIFRLVTTHESFNKSLIAFNLVPKLQTPATRDINNFIIPEPIKNLRLPL